MTKEEKVIINNEEVKEDEQYVLVKKENILSKMPKPTKEGALKAVKTVAKVAAGFALGVFVGKKLGVEPADVIDVVVDTTEEIIE